MKVKVKKNDFKDAIGRVNKILKKNLLYNKTIFMEVSTDEIRLTGVQNAISMQTKIEDVIADEPFKCLFEVNMIIALLSKMTANDIILDYNQKKRELFLVSDMAKVKLRCEDPQNFAGWKKLDEPDFEKETAVLFPRINECKHALPANNANSIMSSFCIQYGNDDWKITALDGYRVSERGKIEKAECTILAPGDTMALLESIFLNGTITIAMKKDQLWIRDEYTTVNLNTVYGNYFNVDNILHTDYPFKININRNELLQALTLANVTLMNGSKKSGIFEFDGKSQVLEIKTEDNIGNQMNSSIPFTGNLDSILEFGINIKYILDAVKNIPDDTITIELKNDVSPMRIAGEEYTEIILPVKLGSN